MTVYRTCRGCEREKMGCDHRDFMRKKLAGLGVTSVKFKCALRKGMFEPGDPVWVLTHAAQGDFDDESGEIRRYQFPGHVVDTTRSTKVLVYIKPGASAQSGGVEFEGRGFCNIVASRIKARDGDREEICRFCGQPNSVGHIEGYACLPAETVLRNAVSDCFF